MSRFEDMITELCPHGVPYVPIGSLIKRERLRGKDDSSIKQVYAVSNTLGIVRAEDMRENTIHSEDTSNYTILRKGMIAYNPSRLNIGSIARLKFEESGLVSPMYVVFSIDENKITQEYFEYMIKSTYVANKIDSLKEEGARFRFDFDRWNWIEIALPPISIQQKIVEILDNFSNLLSSLNEELGLRRKQYDYYLNKLLSFEDDSVEWLTIGEVFDVKNGYTPSKKVPEYWENGTVPWFRMEDIRTNGRVLYDAIQHVHISGIKKSGLFKKNSIMIATTATLGEHAIIKTDYMSNQQLTNLTIKSEYADKITTDFAFFYCFIIDDLCESVANYSGGIPIVDQTKFKLLPFPIPSIAKQQEITELLSKFDCLCNDKQIGLPAEIALRKRQFEYYRNKLLTFSRLEESV